MTTSEKQFLKSLAKVLDTEQLRQKHKLHPDERRTFLNGWFKLNAVTATRYDVPGTTGMLWLVATPLVTVNTCVDGSVYGNDPIAR